MSRDGNKIYNVTFVNPTTGTEQTIQARGDEYILDAAEQQQVQLPYACRAGACVVCTGKVVQGSVDQSDHNFLKPKELNAGFALLCAAYPESDCVIQTHQEEALFQV